MNFSKYHKALKNKITFSVRQLANKVFVLLIIGNIRNSFQATQILNRIHLLTRKNKVLLRNLKLLLLVIISKISSKVLTALKKDTPVEVTI